MLGLLFVVDVDVGEAGAVFEERVEGGADRGLVGDVEVLELVEGGVVGFGGLVGGFKG